MERVVPWAYLIAMIEPLYPTSGRVGRQPIGVARMLRMYCFQQWYGLADEALEDALYDSQALRNFVGTDLSCESAPDATTLLEFRWLLLEQGMLMRAGTIVAATIIAAPSSTKNKGNTRDPEMNQTKKSNQWHFGMKAHIGVDAESSLVHVGLERGQERRVDARAVLGGPTTRRCRILMSSALAKALLDQRLFRRSSNKHKLIM
jgi:transposase, IS5 family